MAVCDHGVLEHGQVFESLVTLLVGQSKGEFEATTGYIEEQLRFFSTNVVPLCIVSSLLEKEERFSVVHFRHVYTMGPNVVLRFLQEQIEFFPVELACSH